MKQVIGSFFSSALLVALTTLCGLPLMATAQSAGVDEPLKVGFVYVSPRGDAGWTAQHDLARQQVDEFFGDRVETTFVEQVAEGADAERVIRNLASRGHGLIFTTSFGYMNPTIKVAQQFPNVKFEHATGYRRAENVGVYLGREYQGRFLDGVLAGAVTESNVLGFVAAFPIPEVIRDINAFMLGAQVTNPDATMKVIWVNSWHDPAVEREAAETLILQGADVLANHTDSAAVVQTAETNGVFSVGFNADLYEYGPNTNLSSTIFNWFPLYRDSVAAVLDGTWESKWQWHGIAEGVIEVAPVRLDAVPETAIATVAALKAGMHSGQRVAFRGPVYNQAGELMIPEGESATDQELLEMNWYVSGVEGQIPGQ